jgi:DNA-directed RNA polymerase subunit E"
MAGPVLRACKECSFIINETEIKEKAKQENAGRAKNEQVPANFSCPRCGGETTREWQGLLAVSDFEKSDIAKRMGISENGMYALRVR